VLLITAGDIHNDVFALWVSFVTIHPVFQ